MKLFYDLHIHSSLSPCADDDMTAANICAMASLKGLDVIAVTDHNAAESLPFAEKAAIEHGLVFIPGIEVTTREEVHLLAYFASVSDAVDAGRFFLSRLPDIKNSAALFGNQWVIDSEDHVVHDEPRMLLNATDLPFKRCCEEIAARNGIYVPAHVNRGANGLLINLGFFPADVPIGTIEVDRKLPVAQKSCEGKHILHSSDAHRLGDIAEAEMYIEVPKREAGSVLRAINGTQT